jgi:hypothetical protein
MTMLVHSKRYLKIGLLVFGAFTIGYNLANLLHELGHVIFISISGGRADHITLNPFSWSYTYYRVVPSNTTLTDAGGVLFGALTALLFIFLAGRLHDLRWQLIFRMAALASLAINGLYLLLDPLLKSGGDATQLLKDGLPLALLLVAGLLLLAGAGHQALQLIPISGFQPQDRLPAYLLTLGVSFLPYFLGILIYNSVFDPRQMRMWSIYAGAGLLVVFFLALLSHKSASHSKWDPKASLAGQGWPFSLYLAGFGLLAITLELVIFH